MVIALAVGGTGLLFVLCCLGVFAFGSVGDSDGDSGSAQPTSIAESIATSTSDPESAGSPTNADQLIESDDRLDLLTKAVNDSLGRSNRAGVDRVETVQAWPDETDRMVIIEWAINDNLTLNLLRFGAQRDVVKLIAVAQEQVSWEYGGLRLIGTFSMVDQYGNASEREVVHLVYDPDTVERINPDGVLIENIYGLADHATVHPEFRS